MLGRSRPDYSARRAGLPFATLLIALALAAPAAAFAAPGSEGPLTPELQTLATPSVSAAPAAAQAEAAGLPTEGPGSLVREGERVIVEAQFEGATQTAVEALTAAGANVRLAEGRYRTAAISVDPADLEAVAAVPGVTAIVPVRRPVYAAFGEPTTAASGAELCEGGSVISQGVAQLNVPAARAAFGARGAGETVGVISDSFNSATKSLVPSGPIATHAHEDEASDDLPGPSNGCSGQSTPVRVIAEAPTPEPEEEELTDEGRGMLQVVHDVAPEAHLAFATAEGGELELARNIERLAAPVSAGGAGADVIVDDVAYLGEPYFQDGPVAAAIQRVTAAGVTYLTAAGNDNTFEGSKEIGSWEAPRYRPIGCPEALDIALGEVATGCMDFDPSPSKEDATYGMEVAAHGTVGVDLQWAEPRFGVHTDLDAYLFNGKGKLLAKSDLDSIEIGQPFELPEYTNPSGKGQEVLLVIRRVPTAGAGLPRLKFMLLGEGVTRVEPGYTESREGDVVGPTIFGHAGAAAAITLGAVRYTESASAPVAPEAYSSRGPVTHYFGPVTSAQPAAPLAGPEVVAKPNLTATDCASTTFFAQLEGSSWHFCGTSEAAPHAAAVAALMHQINPLASPAAIAAAMESSATKFTGVTSPDAVGAGLLNADAAMTTLGRPPAPPAEPTPTVTITKGPSALGRVTRPSFDFTSTVAATFTCQVDGGPALPCASPYLLPTALGDGRHGFVVTARNAQGATGSSGIYAFTVDTTAPKTSFAKKPSKLLRTRGESVIARFRLRASESPVTFYCEIDKEPLRICGKSFHHRFSEGAHVVKVKAKDAAGNLAARWAVDRFRVKPLRRARPARHR